MRRSAPLRAGLLLTVAFLACNSDPSKPIYWVSRLTSKSVQQKIEACSKLRKMNDTADEDKIAPLLKDEDPRVKQAAAEALGDLGAKSAVSDLSEALDFSVGGGNDRETRSANEANRAIALALGKLGDRKASPALLKLLHSRDHYVVLAAVESLGKLHETAAVGPLMDIATDDNQEPFIAKKAIMALGRIGDPKAVPAIEKMLFRERQGVSFYPESSFAVFEIGDPAATPLINLLDGRDKPFEKWAEDNQILPEALFAKTAQVLGDVGDVRADPALLGKLKYESDSDYKLLVRANAAESLGRLRDRAAAKPIASMLGETEANIRDSYGRALVLIGDRDVVPELEKASLDGNWDDREGSIHALSNLGTGKEVPFLEKVSAAEPATWAKECKDSGSSDADCAKAEEKHKATMKGHLARLLAAKECGDKGDCWLGKLKDPQGPVRERAAFELGREGDPKAIPALLEALKDDDLFARFAENAALGWLIEGSAAGKAQAKAAATRLDAILEDEDGKVYYIKIDEDLKRLAARLEKLTQSPSPS
jgi:HEAT repeat protein